MILIGLGANLPSPAGEPKATLAAALDALDEEGVRILAHSRLYRSAPVPPSSQPPYINAVASLGTALDPRSLLAHLLTIEARFGRTRDARNAARTLDLDLLDYDGAVSDAFDLALPHPRLHERAFVLRPLLEIAPRWRHPVLGLSADVLLASLPPGQDAAPL
ncbi:MAG: 2-amino-4-hydroxy-6-hydroxymethyldihydropteridine diphosphokinase [Stellaceae bacterium]